MLLTAVKRVKDLNMPIVIYFTGIQQIGEE